MIIKSVTKSLVIPDRFDLENQFQPNTPLKETLFDILTDPEIVLKIITAPYYTTEYSPIFLVVEPVLKAAGIRSLEDSDKRFVGGLVLWIMTNNGYKKNGDKKQEKSGSIFSTGQIYIPR